MQGIPGKRVGSMEGNNETSETNEREGLSGFFGGSGEDGDGFRPRTDGMDAEIGRI
jgi:hypothetical protein